MSETAQHPVVRLRDGMVRGRVEAGVAAFLGIPYAAPPFGPNRMLPPQPVSAWAGERDATAFGPTPCIASSSLSESRVRSSKVT